jgi:hypothetical protein
MVMKFIGIESKPFHLTHKTADVKGGWSYSLNRKDTVSSDEILFSSTISDDKSIKLVFDGRTPCQEIAAEHPEMNAGQSCFKLKWRFS